MRKPSRGSGDGLAHFLEALDRVEDLDGRSVAEADLPAHVAVGVLLDGSPFEAWAVRRASS
jgi:hypothetical protein